MYKRQGQGAADQQQDLQGKQKALTESVKGVKREPEPAKIEVAAAPKADKAGVDELVRCEAGPHSQVAGLTPIDTVIAHAKAAAAAAVAKSAKCAAQERLLTELTPAQLARNPCCASTYTQNLLDRLAAARPQGGFDAKYYMDALGAFLTRWIPEMPLRVGAGFSGAGLAL